MACSVLPAISLVLFSQGIYTVPWLVSILYNLVQTAILIRSLAWVSLAAEILSKSFTICLEAHTTLFLMTPHW